MDDGERQAWIADLKRRCGLRCIGDEEDAPPVPGWPVLSRGGIYTTVAEYAMASYDGVNFYVKPDGMPLSEWWAALP